MEKHSPSTASETLLSGADVATSDLAEPFESTHSDKVAPLGEEKSTESCNVAPYLPTEKAKNASGDKLSRATSSVVDVSGGNIVCHDGLSPDSVVDPAVADPRKLV